ncbi:MAG: Origin recognition complex, subunit 1, partial [Paramarteilia canceri]
EKIIGQSLCCREEEHEKLLNILTMQVKSKSSATVYISGVPGTGKTATVNSVLSYMKNQSSLKGLFEDLFINAMSLSNPKQLYEFLAEKIKGFPMTSTDSLNYLMEYFLDGSKKRKKILILVVDEVDYLCTKKQDLFYNLYNWSSCNNSNLIVVSISNTFDLPEKMMNRKVSSRF